MKTQLMDLFRKLTSRKLWMAIAGVATGIATIVGVEGSEISTVAGSVMALASVITYIITEGKIDAESAKWFVEEVEEETEDTEPKVGF